jgi:hypothetical protein
VTSAVEDLQLYLGRRVLGVVVSFLRRVLVEDALSGRVSGGVSSFVREIDDLVLKKLGRTAAL